MKVIFNLADIVAKILIYIYVIFYYLMCFSVFIWWCYIFVYIYIYINGNIYKIYCLFFIYLQNITIYPFSFNYWTLIDLHFCYWARSFGCIYSPRINGSDSSMTTTQVWNSKTQRYKYFICWQLNQTKVVLPQA